MPNTKSSKSSKKSQKASAEKLLRRPKEGDTRKLLAGVAVAFADYFRIDVVLVRLIILFLMFAGPGLLMYLFAWLIIPEQD